MTLTSVIITGISDSGDPACPICGSRAWDREDIFARCQRCGSEVTIAEDIGIRPAPGRCCPEFDCLYAIWDTKHCRACGADCKDCPTKRDECHDR